MGREQQRMRVLVTGAQGCIGAWVVKQLLEKGAGVIAFDLDPNLARLSLIAPPDLIAKLRVETGRLEDGPKLKSLVREAGITHIVHLAATLIPFCQQQPAAGAMVNVVGTLSVFEAAREAGWPVRVVYASSAAVWGPGSLYGDRALNEDDSPRPATHYGVFKLANESCAEIFHQADGISSIGLRPWTVYGVGRDEGLTAGPTLAMKATVLGRPFRIGLTGCMDLQYVEDVAQAFVQCAMSPLDGAHVFNLAGSVVRVDEFLALLEKLRPGSKGLITAEGPEVPVACRMDDARLQRAIPGIRRTPLEAGMRKTLDLFELLKQAGRLV
jgi:nucleoside-diphosphate-sugar epimerase